MNQGNGPVRTLVQRFTPEDVAKKRLRQNKNEVPDSKIANALNIWVKWEGWHKDIPSEVLRTEGMGIDDITQLVYRYGHTKGMLKPEEWLPTWGRRPRRAQHSGWTDEALNEKFKEIDEQGSATLERLQTVKQRVSDWDISKIVGRLGSIEENLATALQDLDKDNDRLDKIEHKLTHRGPRPLSSFTKFRREIQRRIRILARGGK